MMKKRVFDVVWDMETNDPDDFLALLMLIGHPQINLKAVTVFPGSAAQIGIVRHALDWFQLDIPIGARNLDTTKESVSAWHYQAFGDIPPSRNAKQANEVLLDNCDVNSILITGAPLTNIRNAIRTAQSKNETFQIDTIVVQGGFAGEGIVPPELQMEKFKSLRTCPTHNLMVDRKAAQLVLDYEGFKKRYFVSKNVCHRLVYDHDMHEQIAEVKDSSIALNKIWRGMNVYLHEINPNGKMLHDLLAVACAIDSTVGTWAEVELFREGSEWGAKSSENSNTWIIIDYDHDKFMSIFTALGGV